VTRVIAKLLIAVAIGIKQVLPCAGCAAPSQEATMPTADRYARYRADQTTIWVSKNAATFLARERTAPSEGVAAVLDRLLNELKKLRRGGGAVAGASKRSAPARAAGAAKVARTRTSAVAGRAAKQVARRRRAT
jgi:hypothetical protein